MARIVGVDLPKEKRLIIALTYIYGVGPHLSNQIINQLGLDPSKRVKNLDENEIVSIRELVRSFQVEGDLRLDRLKMFAGLRRSVLLEGDAMLKLPFVVSARIPMLVPDAGKRVYERKGPIGGVIDDS